jgi:hypothetical protein
MTPHEEDAAARRYFDEHYEVIAHHPLVAPRPILLPFDNPDRRQCRFCGRDTTQVKFKNDAHAVSNLLGNKSLFTLNECNECNTSLGQKYEDQLGKWSNLARAVAQIPGKKNKKPKFKGDDGLVVEAVESGLSIHVPTPHSPDELLANGVPEEIELTGDTSSQPHVPIRAAMALVKIGCSVCSTAELVQCQNAIDWLIGRRQFKFSQFPVHVAVTPGPINENASEVVMLRRKGDGSEPYLWCVVQFCNFRFQVFVPGCPADECWSREGSNRPVTFKHYPSRFGPDWPFGPTRFFWGDWSGQELVKSSAKVTFRVAKFIGVTRPGQEAK